MGINERIGTLEVEVKERQAELSALKTERAEGLCPFRIGQVLVRPKTGASREERRRITAILSDFSYPRFGKGYRVMGIHLLKNGSDGQNTNELFNLDRWHLEEED